MSDLTKWRLAVDEGRQTWQYHDELDVRPQTMAEKYFLGLEIVWLFLQNSDDHLLFYSNTQPTPKSQRKLLTSLLPKISPKLSKTASLFTVNCKQKMVTGPTIMAAPCS